MGYRRLPACHHSEFNIYNNTLTRTFHVMCYKLFTAYLYSNTIFVRTRLLEPSMGYVTGRLPRIAILIQYL